MDRLPLQNARWQQAGNLAPNRFICGFCSTTVSSSSGWFAVIGNNQVIGNLYVCPECQGPNFRYGDLQFPTAAFGKPVAHVPNELNALYEEARSCTSGNSFTAAVLICRKMLMNIGGLSRCYFASSLNFPT
jgi:hypothetical protein